MSYPAGEALVTFFGAIPNFTVPTGFEPDQAIARAIKDWEARSGWTPFVKDAVDKTHYYDPPRAGSFGCFLDLKRGLLDVTSIVIGCDLDGTGGSVATNSVDFLYAPYDAGLSENPFTGLRFLTAPYGGPRSIKIVGRWGYSAECPEDVQLAILMRAAAIALPIAGGPAGAMRRVKQGPVEYEFDTTAGRDTRSLFLAEFTELANLRSAPWL